MSAKECLSIFWAYIASQSVSLPNITVSMLGSALIAKISYVTDTLQGRQGRRIAILCEDVTVVWHVTELCRYLWALGFIPIQISLSNLVRIYSHQQFITSYAKYSPLCHFWPIRALHLVHAQSVNSSHVPFW